MQLAPPLLTAFHHFGAQIFSEQTNSEPDTNKQTIIILHNGLDWNGLTIFLTIFLPSVIWFF